MFRHPSLRPLSRQHHHALALCVLIRRGLAAAQPDVEQLARRVLRDFEGEIRLHFEAEEQILFPEARQAAELEPLVERLLGEHRQMKGLVERLAAQPAAAELEAFASLLYSHVRVEENELFEQLQHRLDAGALARLGEALERLPGAACSTEGTGSP
ncbi:MAG: hemerythrin domain-containing protein [Bryobacteraceae bacterium]